MNIEYSFWTTVSDKSPMKVLFELVRKSEGILQRIEETQNGFVLATSVPGQANSGAIYIYDRLCGALVHAGGRRPRRRFQPPRDRLPGAGGCRTPQYA